MNDEKYTDEQTKIVLAERDSLIIEISPIKSDDDRQRYNAARIQAKECRERLDGRRKSIVDPIRAALDNANRQFKEWAQPIVDFDAALAKELQADRQRQLEATAKEQRRLDALAQKRVDNAVAKGKPTPLPVPVAAVVQDTGKSVETDTGKVTWIDNYVPEIYDESLIPREYLMPDMAKITALVKANVKINGVRRVNKPFQRVSR